MKTNEANCFPCAPCSTESHIDTRSVLDFCCDPLRDGSGCLFGMQVRALYVRLLRQLTSNRDNSSTNGVAVVTSMWLQFVCLLIAGVILSQEITPSPRETLPPQRTNCGGLEWLFRIRVQGLETEAWSLRLEAWSLGQLHCSCAFYVSLAAFYSVESLISDEMSQGYGAVGVKLSQHVV